MRLFSWRRQGGRLPLSSSRRTPISLFGEILDWMLAPLLFVWPISIVATHHVAQSIANQPYDQAMAEEVRAIARLVKVSPRGRLVANFPAAARTLLHGDEEDALYFRVSGPRGQLLAGDIDLPSPGALSRDDLSASVQFDDDEINGEDIRIASRMVELPTRPNPTLVMVQVGETRNKREALASQIIAGVLLPQFLVIPATIVLVWVGLTRGIAPLSRLQAMIRRRRPVDMSPIDENGAPEEVQPLISAFNDMIGRLEENLQAQQRFVADAAHQMRTPLAGLKMQAELALEERDPEVLRQSLQRIHAGAERAAHLINQLLALARAEACSPQTSAFERVDLGRLALDVAAEFVPRAMSKGVDLGAEIDDHPLIEGNPVLLRELLANLIDNAIKYSRRDGQVTVFTERDAARPDLVVLGVRDQGIGIPVAEQQRIFMRFHRVLGTGEEGSGLGLAIVREIAELHGAKVSIDSTPERPGACFRIAFARAAANPTLAPPA